MYIVPAMNLKLHERKYELDSLLSVINLAYTFYNTTKSMDIFKDATRKADWLTAMNSIMDIIEVFISSPYAFIHSLLT